MSLPVRFVTDGIDVVSSLPVRILAFARSEPRRHPRSSLGRLRRKDIALGMASIGSLPAAARDLCAFVEGWETLRDTSLL